MSGSKHTNAKPRLPQKQSLAERSANLKDSLARPRPRRDKLSKGSCEPEETDKEAQARLAATPFVVSDLYGPCPVPTKARWIEDAKSTLVWLRFGFVILCSDREKLTGILGGQDEQQFIEMQDGLGIALRNFTQMAAVAQQALDRIQIGLAILAEDEDRAADGG